MRSSRSVEIGQPRAEGGSLVVLVSNALQFGLARAYSVYPGEARARIHITYSFGEALEWIGRTGKERKRLEAFLMTD